MKGSILYLSVAIVGLAHSGAFAQWDFKMNTVNADEAGGTIDARSPAEEKKW